MRGFSLIYKVFIISYLLAIIINFVVIFKLAPEEKFVLLKNFNKSNKDNNINRIILFGDSECELSLYAESIKNKINSDKDYIVINMCKDGMDRFNYRYFDELIKYTNKNDIIIITSRLNFNNNKETLNKRKLTPSEYLLPHLSKKIRFLNNLFTKNYRFNEFGDVKIPFFPDPIIFKNYNINYETINKNMNNFLNHIFDNKNIKSKVIITFAPLLFDDNQYKDFEINKIIYKCDVEGCSNLKKIVTPIIFKEIKYFEGKNSDHVNDLGSDVWVDKIMLYLNPLI